MKEEGEERRGEREQQYFHEPVLHESTLATCITNKAFNEHNLTACPGMERSGILSDEQRD